MSVKEKFLAAVNVIESLPSDGKEVFLLYGQLTKKKLAEMPSYVIFGI